MKKYKFVRNHEVEALVRIDDNTSIPFDEANTDYQEYLEWIAEGNEPEPADTITDNGGA